MEGAWAGARRQQSALTATLAVQESQATEREKGERGEGYEAWRRAGSLRLCIKSAAGSDQDRTETPACGR